MGINYNIANVGIVVIKDVTVKEDIKAAKDIVVEEEAISSLEVITAEFTIFQVITCLQSVPKYQGSLCEFYFLLYFEINEVF